MPLIEEIDTDQILTFLYDRELMNEETSLLQQAEAVHPDAPDIEDLLQQVQTTLDDLNEMYAKQCALALAAAIPWPPGLPMSSKLCSSALAQTESSIHKRLKHHLESILGEISIDLHTLLQKAQVKEGAMSHAIHQVPFVPLFIVRLIRQMLAQKYRKKIQLVLEDTITKLKVSGELSSDTQIAPLHPSVRKQLFSIMDST